MSRIVLPVASWIVLTSLVGCDSSSSTASDPPAMITVRRVDPGSVSTGSLAPDQDVGPIVFHFEGSRGYIRATMHIHNGKPGSNPFIHDALFLAKGDGRLSIAIRKPSPGHERGQVLFRCEGGGEDSTVEYEPELWYGNPDRIPVTIEVPDGSMPARVKEGEELDLGKIIAGPGRDGSRIPGPLRMSFNVTFGAEPIKPRVKAGVRAPR